MIKVISFSLWGDMPRYTIGAIKNAELALHFYPDFECWFYIHKDTVPDVIVKKLREIKNTKIIFKDGDLNICKPMTWRFEAIDNDDVEIMMCRDTDTRILLREKLAVDEWLCSGKTFHIMRDHPHHVNVNYPIFAGMFGTRKIKNVSNWKLLLDRSNSINKFDDQSFLNKYIYKNIIYDCLIHSSFGGFTNENWKPFPIPYCDKFLFVGGYVYEDETVSDTHINILKNAEKK